MKKLPIKIIIIQLLSIFILAGCLSESDSINSYGGDVTATGGVKGSGALPDDEEVIAEGGIKGSGITDTNDGDLVAEGGIKGSGVTPPAPEENTQITAHGPITAFGSVIVNGVKFETDSTTVAITDQPAATSNDLKLGMVVNVEGTVDPQNGVVSANNITFDQDVVGPILYITPIDISTVEINVLGLRVLITDDIVFENVTFQTLGLFQMVTVSGQVNEDDILIATRVEKIANEFIGGTKSQVEATVQSIDTNNQTLEISSLTIDYSNADLTDFPANQIAVNQFVEIRGESFDNNGVFIANSIQLLNENINPLPGTMVSLNGFISNFVSIANFTVYGQQVDASATGIDPASLRNDVKVDVSGIVNTQGILIADSLTVLHASGISIAGAITEVAQSSNTISVLGIEMTLDSLATFEDTSGNNRFFSFNDIQVGDWVEVWAYMDNNVVTINRIEKAASTDKIRLEGIISSIIGSEFNILGLTIDGSAPKLINIISLLLQGAVVEIEGFSSSDNKITADTIKVADYSESDEEKDEESAEEEREEAIEEEEEERREEDEEERDELAQSMKSNTQHYGHPMPSKQINTTVIEVSSWNEAAELLGWTAGDISLASNSNGNNENSQGNEDDQGYENDDDEKDNLDKLREELEIEEERDEIEEQIEKVYQSDDDDDEDEEDDDDDSSWKWWEQW